MVLVDLLKNLYGCKILDEEKYLETLLDDIFIAIAIETENIRKKIYEKFPYKKYTTLIHPSVKISSTNEIGKESTICAGCI